MKIFLIYLVLNWVAVEMWNKYFYTFDRLYILEFFDDLKEGMNATVAVGYFLVFMIGGFLGLFSWVYEKFFRGA